MSNYYRMYKTTDGGNNWQTIIQGTNPSHDILFLNENTGFYCGNTIFKTTNGGVNYFFTLQYPGYEIYSLNFLNDFTGYAAGASGNVLKTTNCGENWLPLNRITNNGLKSIWFVNDSTGFVAGNNGTILKTTNSGGQIVGLSQYQSAIPEKFYLYQNFPNPFNPIAKIKFDIPNQSSAKIVIHDLMGREVATLVNEQLSPGSYEVDWDGTGFASGVYFYSLVTESFVETKRMVLIK